MKMFGSHEDWLLLINCTHGMFCFAFIIYPSIYLSIYLFIYLLLEENHVENHVLFPYFCVCI